VAKNQMETEGLNLNQRVCPECGQTVCSDERRRVQLRYRGHFVCLSL